MMNPNGLKVRRYSASMIDLNNYLVVFPGAKASEMFCDTELDGFVLNSMPKIRINQAYVQRFDFESNTFKAAVSIFESIEITEYFMKLL